MVAKKYSPVRVHNPYEGHVVPLMPNQDFIVYISGCTRELDYCSQFFELKETNVEENGTYFTFLQKYDLSLWSRISKVFLGEVMTISDNRLGTLCVYLDAVIQNKTKITVINPDVNSLKVDPQSILEIVIYDDNFQGEWNCSIISGNCGLKYEQVEYRKVDPRPHQSVFNWKEVNNPYFAYPRSIVFDSPIPAREHHYWFRCDYSTMVAVAQLAPGLYAGGKIVFDTDTNDSLFRVLNVNLNIREKNRSKLFEGLTPSRSQSSMPPIIVPQVIHPKFRRLLPVYRDSLRRQEIVFKQKEDTNLHSDKVLYF